MLRSYSRSWLRSVPWSITGRPQKRDSRALREESTPNQRKASSQGSAPRCWTFSPRPRTPRRLTAKNAKKPHRCSPSLLGSRNSLLARNLGTINGTSRSNRRKTIWRSVILLIKRHLISRGLSSSSSSAEEWSRCQMTSRTAPVVDGSWPHGRITLTLTTSHLLATQLTMNESDSL